MLAIEKVSNTKSEQEDREDKNIQSEIHYLGEWEGDSLACQADFALGALPTCPPQRGHRHVQAHPMVMLTTAGAEELVQQVPWAITQRAMYIIYNYGQKNERNRIYVRKISENLISDSTVDTM